MSVVEKGIWRCRSVLVVVVVVCTITVKNMETSGQYFNWMPGVSQGQGMNHPVLSHGLTRNEEFQSTKPLYIGFTSISASGQTSNITTATKSLHNVRKLTPPETITAENNMLATHTDNKSHYLVQLKSSPNTIATHASTQMPRSLTERIPVLRTKFTPLSRKDIADVRILIFVGFARSGHSIVGILMDAHPDIIIAHEYILKSVT